MIPCLFHNNGSRTVSVLSQDMGSILLLVRYRVFSIPTVVKQSLIPSYRSVDRGSILLLVPYRVYSIPTDVKQSLIPSYRSVDMGSILPLVQYRVCSIPTVVKQSLIPSYCAADEGSSPCSALVLCAVYKRSPSRPGQCDASERAHGKTTLEVI